MLFNLKVNSDVKLSAKNVDASGTNTHMLHMYMLYKSKRIMQLFLITVTVR